MTVIVYKFGVHYKWTKGIPSTCMDQLYLAHQFREGLVSLHLEFEDAKKAIWSSVPAIKDLEDALDAQQDIQLAQNAIIADARKLQRTRSPQGPAVDAAQAAINAAKAASKALRSQISTLKKDVYKTNQTVRDDMTAASQVKFAEEKALKATMIERGLYHATAYLITNQHRTAIKNLTQKRKQGNPAQLRHHRFEGTGNLMVSLKSREGINTRNPAEISDPSGPHRNTFCMKLPSVADWDGLTGSQRRHDGRVIARFRIATGKADDTNVIELPVQVHRALPNDAIIKSATLNVSKIGTRKVAHILLSVTIPDPIQLPDESTLFCHFGWRSEDTKDGKTVRSLTWRSDTPLEEWPTMRVDPRYADLAKCMVVADDLMSGTVAIPATWSNKIDTSDELRSARDEALNTIRDELIAWLTTVGPIDHPTLIDRETGLPIQVTAADVAHWRSPRRFVTLALGWRHNPPTQTSASKITASLEAWRAMDKRLYDTQTGTSTRAARRRDDLYAQVANLLGSAYDTIIMDEVDHAKLATRPNKDESITNELSKLLGRQRSFAAAATLRQKIASVAARNGATITKISSAYVSTIHAACATLNVRKRGQMKVMCRTCKSKYDVDDNALDVLQLRG